MVSKEKGTNTALNHYRLGTVLVWVGVLTWVPFIILRATGSTPSLFWFLPFHLFGVIGGSRLRKLAHREMKSRPAPQSKLRTMGHLLIFIGIMVWGIYFYLKFFTQIPVGVGQFLPFHLIGVLSGAFLLLVNFFLKWREE